VNDKGITFGILLTIAFIGLKLIGAISWSWWWVLAPIWLPVVIAIIIAVLLYWANK